MSYTFLGTTVTGWSNISIVINKQIGDDIPNAEIIGSGAFFNKGYIFQLPSLVLPPNINQIRDNAYNGAYGINGTIHLFNLTNLQVIGSGAFQNCNKVTGLTLPTSLITINNFAFNNCSKLKGPLDLSSLTNLINIGFNAFQNCFELTSLTLPNNVQTIFAGAFMNCVGLAGSLTLSNLTKLTSIEQDVFNNCTRLTSVSFPTSLVTIGIRAFYNCSMLSNSIDLSSTQVTTIGDSAFRICNISSLIFPITLTSLSVNICSNASLTSVYFQSGCTLQPTSFPRPTNAIVYAKQGNQFTIGPASGTFSTTINPLVSFFSKWRLYDQPYPTDDVFFSSSVNTFYKAFTPGTDFTFYTYNVNIVDYYVVVKDSLGDPVKYPNGDVIDQPTVTRSGYLYTFSYASTKGLPNGSKTLTLNNSNLVLYLVEIPCTIINPLVGFYNIGGTINITWSGTNPPYLVFLIGQGFTQSYSTTNDSYTFPIPNYFTAGTYNIKIFNQNGCYAISNPFLINSCITITPMDGYYTEFINVSWIGSNAPYTLTLKGPNGFELEMDTTNLNTLTWAVPTDILPGLHQVQVSTTDCSVLSNLFLILTIEDICFVKDTLVETDQGNIPIQSIVPGKHTVFNQKIIDITKTIHPDSHLVHIKAFAFGTYPTKDTTVSQEHKINGINSFREARHYVNGTTVTLVPYDFQPLYNVLLIRPGFMRVHGMMVETLDPYVMKHEPKRPLLKR